MSGIVLAFAAQYKRSSDMGNKPETITFRVSAEFKALLVERAKAQHRSITSYLEWLVLQESAAAKTEPKNRRG
jgi:uncharacterized protein (DUF1778 family)